MTGVTCMMAGSRSILDTQTVTSGSTSVGTDPVYNYYGYKGTGTPTFGSISDGTSNLYGGAAINGIYFYEEGSTLAGGYYLREIILIIAGTQTNDGWSTMTIGSTTYSRTDAFSFSTAGGVSTWTWSIPFNSPSGTSGSPGPFSATTSVTWS